MCVICGTKTVGRRGFLKFGAGALAAAALAASAPAYAADGAPTSLSPDEALAKLKAGNERFVSHPEVCSLDLAEQDLSLRASLLRCELPILSDRKSAGAAMQSELDHKDLQPG